MSWTSTDLSNVEAAITELATGQRVVDLMIGGKTIRYQPADMDKLVRLRSLIQSELQTGAFINKVKFVNPT